ncbi:hypothetical protein FHT21_003127 [Pedobacter sp. SG908]|nr:hypothetical protein [Pedobacter sp. SG908]NMN39058.1 hypothetical protein [Pedobacter sp. SG918]
MVRVDISSKNIGPLLFNKIIGLPLDSFRPLSPITSITYNIYFFES